MSSWKKVTALLCAVFCVLFIGAWAPITDSPVAAAETNTDIPMPDVDQLAINQSSPLLVIFDMSGSMDELDESGKTKKVESAKTAMYNMLASGNMKASLWTYPGGPEDNGCEAGEWVSGASWTDDADATKVAATIKSLSATGGNTPTGPAVDRAVRQSATDVTTEVIVVSDGEQNCGEPLCDTVKTLKDDGYDFRLSTVGFALEGEGESDLTCAAEVAGGQYTPVGDATAMKEYVDNIAESGLKVSVDDISAAQSGTSLSIRATISNSSTSRELTGVAARLQWRPEDAKFIAGQDANMRKPSIRIPPLGSQTFEWNISTSSAEGTFHWSVSVSADGSPTQKIDKATRLSQDFTGATGPLLEGIKGKVVVMGDSYSSGEGTKSPGQYDEDKTKWCHRSVENTYASRIFGQDRVEVIACSGAVTGDFFSRQATLQGSEKSQLDRLNDMVRSQDVGAVFLTIGGNDAQFGGIAEQTLFHWSTEFKDWDISNWGRADKQENAFNLGMANAKDLFHDIPFADNAEDQYADLLSNRVGRLPRVYAAVNRVVNDPKQVQKRGRLVPIIISSYPSPVWDKIETRCNNEIDETEVAGIWAFASFLNVQTASAVRYTQKALNAPLYFVDTHRIALPGHTLCVSDQENSFFRFVDRPTGIGTKAGDTIASPFGGGEAFQELLHPTAEGHEAWARKIESTLATMAYPDTDSYQPSPVRMNVSRNEKLLIRRGIALYPSLSDNVGASTTLTSSAGTRVRIEASGAAPGSTAIVTFHSKSRLLAVGMADEQGKVVLEGALPAETIRGKHTMSLVGTDVDGKEVHIDYTVHVYSPMPLWVLLVAITGVLALIAGLVFRWLGREPREPRTTRKKTNIEATQRPVPTRRSG